MSADDTSKGADRAASTDDTPSPATRRVSLPVQGLERLCRQHHIRRLALFGSVLRPDFGPDSDIDVLVEFEAGHTPGFRFVTIERELSNLLGGRKIDLVTLKFLNHRIRDHVLAESKTVYVAG